MDNDKQKRIVPIIFTDRQNTPADIPEKKVTCPIEFIKKPINFVAQQRCEDGSLKEVVVEKSAIAGTIIPCGVNVEEFENVCIKLMEGKGLFYTEGQEQTKTESVCEDIVRSPKGDKRNEMEDLCNYELFPLYKRIFKDREGKINYNLNEIAVKIQIKEKFKTVTDLFTIKCMEIDKITKVIAKKYPSAIIYDKKDAAKIENDFREKSSQMKEITCYTDAGWQMVGNKCMYLHAGIKVQGAEVLSNLDLPELKGYTKKEIGKIWLMSLGIYKKYEVAAVISIYSFLGVTYKVFDEAGFAPHFLLFLTGKTGSLKTTIAKIFYTQLADEQHRDFPRRIDADTVVSFERALVLSGRDTVTLIDDYSPAKDRQSKVEMGKKLESIIRMVGDGSTKSRSNITLDDCRGEGVKGAVVLTGELRGKGLSSNLRCLYCEMEKEDVELETVSWFQRNKYAYTTIIQHFIYFLSCEWVNVVTFVKENFEIRRREAEGKVEARRLIDVYVVLWILSDIVGWFLVSYCGLQEDDISKEMDFIQKDILNVVIRSEMLSKEENPALIFMRAMVTMLENKKIHLKQERLQCLDLNLFDGFEDDNYIYLLPDSVYQKVSAWLRMGGLYMGIELSQLGALLCNEGFAVSTSNGANKRLCYARIDVGEGRKAKFIKIPKSIVRSLQETE